MNPHISILPGYLIKRYNGWKKTKFEKNKLWFKEIAIKGQNPSIMVISCCDARIHVTSIFGTESGEFFIHRNIANLVPPYNPNGDHHGTSAAIEYAVKNLKVSNIIIMGHSKCGGIHNGYHLFNQKRNLQDTSFVNKWLSILEPAYQKVISKNNTKNHQDAINNLEKESIKISINNLIQFPFINDALKNKELTLNGLWHDIGTGNIESLDPVSLEFIKIK